MYNFLCVGGDKYGCNAFTEGSNGKIATVTEALESDSSIPLCWAGSHKKLLVDHCIDNSRKFYNLDSGYFGNKKTKNFVRISVNEYQNTKTIVPRPQDRWDSLAIEDTCLKQGSTIVLVPPDTKKVHLLNLESQEQWIENTVNLIKQYSDRQIRIRQRPASRVDRVEFNTFKDFVNENTHCVVGHSSNALVEAAMWGIPVIALGPSATQSLYSSDITSIENIKPVDQELKQAWLNHLAYSQFHKDELLSGKAWELLASEPSSIRSRA
jgi:dipeptidyl aminopeptidase/acylaminoacyl peptidase